MAKGEDPRVTPLGVDASRLQRNNPKPNRKWIGGREIHSRVQEGRSEVVDARIAMRILDDAAASVSYAGFWRRAIAYVIDSMIVVGPILTVVDAFAPDLIANRDGRLHLIVLPIMFFYWSGFESSRWQATPAKRWLGIVVTHVDGDRLSFGRAAARWLARILSSIAFLGYAIAAFTERKQALHDLLAHSVVIKGRP